jgi:hypothetical protein
MRIATSTMAPAAATAGAQGRAWRPLCACCTRCVRAYEIDGLRPRCGQADQQPKCNACQGPHYGGHQQRLPPQAPGAAAGGCRALAVRRRLGVSPVGRERRHVRRACVARGRAAQQQGRVVATSARRPAARCMEGSGAAARGRAEAVPGSRSRAARVLDRGPRTSRFSRRCHLFACAAAAARRCETSQSRGNAHPRRWTQPRRELYPASASGVGLGVQCRKSRTRVEGFMSSGSKPRSLATPA